MKSKMMTVVVVAVMLMSTVGSAEVITWVGTGGDNSWFNPANWTPPGLPTRGATGDTVFINGVTSPAVAPVIATTGAELKELHIQNDGLLTITAGTNGNWGLQGSGSSYNCVHDGTLNVSGSYKMAQNFYIGHTSAAGSYGTVNILPGGTVQTGGVLTIAGRRGSGEMNIWGTYILSMDIRWDYMPVSGVEYTSVLRMFDGGLFSWTGDHISNDDIGWAIRNGHLVSGISGYEVSAIYDEYTNITNVTLTAIPEPMTLAMMAMGGLILKRKR